MGISTSTIIFAGIFLFVVALSIGLLLWSIFSPSEQVQQESAGERNIVSEQEQAHEEQGDQEARERREFLCQAHQGDEGLFVSCQEAIAHIEGELPGSVMAIEQLDDSQQFVPPDHREGVWTVHFFLEEQIAFEHLALDAGTSFLVFPGGGIVPHAFFEP